jgi:MauM/NapG family ferredoxin protein
VKATISKTNLRRTVQVICLIGFLWLFLQTEYRGYDELPFPVSLLFRLDPLAALADTLAPGAFNWQLLWPALLLIALTILFGRFFCGWICPLGTTLDGCGKLLGRGTGILKPAWRRVKYLLLIGMVIAGLFGVQLLGLLDPLAIFLRSLTLSIYPVYNLLMNAIFDFTYQHQIPLVSSSVNALYPLWRDNLMAFYQPVFNLALLTLIVFLGIILLEKIERRFWCKNLCPLGALFGICASRALLTRTPDGLCEDCQLCSSACRMDAVGAEGQRPGECIECLDCTGYCPHERVQFNLGKSRPKDTSVDLTRRGIITSLAAGALIAPTVKISPDQAKLNPYLLRPPGAVAEDEFLSRCIRCGECMKVCIGQALHPALFEAGAVGLWSPLLVPRIGYCEYNCTLCGQVCPTGAIRPLAVAEKRKIVIGIAVFDKDRCLPFARGEECLVCEEHCPTGDKAIVFDEKEVLVNSEIVQVKMPRIVRNLCIGCGICETRCPVDGASAIRVLNEDESRRTLPGAGVSIPYG